MGNDDYLQFRNVSKGFPGVRALDGVSFGVAEGSVHGLVGENGAGKSTLLKILSGAYSLDSGGVRIDGKDCRFNSTAEAINAGIAVIYQELQLVPEMSAAENLYLGHLPSSFGVVDRRRLQRDSLKQLRQLGEDISPAARVSRLSIAQRQMVEIARALTLGAKIIAFDEPTSSLTARDVHNLFGIIGALKRQGCVILYVSHRIDEIFEICDSVTVFRDGKHVETFQSLDDVTHDILVSRMVGRDIADVYGYTPRKHGGTALEAVSVTGPGLSQPASFSVAEGEVLGFFGLVGAGRSELLRLVYGAAPRLSGGIRLHGAKARIADPGDAIRHGLMFCPEDRKKDGIVPIRSVMENLNLSARRNHSHLGFLINSRWERGNCSSQVDRLGIKTPSFSQLALNLSGGNQQKLILARWLSENVRVLLLDEPTRGIDVGAKSEIYSIIYELAERGIAIVMVSSDLPEVLGVCDRILVMREGMIVASLAREEADEEKVLRFALPSGDHELATAVGSDLARDVSS